LKRPAQYFRAGVGAVIRDRRRRVLVCKRRDVRAAWQFPQGGLELGEKPIDAVFREIQEEVGFKRSSLRLLARYPEWLVYELPRRARSPKTGLGQAQYWFLFELKREFPPRPFNGKSEFVAAEWVSFDEAVTRIVSFKRPVYRKLQEYFGDVA
jgi:putative (di)nucleoside polyphosphate hydrolase